MACKSKCILAKEPHQFGHAPKMISTQDGDTYAKGTVHDQCLDCMIFEAKLSMVGQEELNAKILTKAFSDPGLKDAQLFQKFEALKKKKL